MPLVRAHYPIHEAMCCQQISGHLSDSHATNTLQYPFPRVRLDQLNGFQKFHPVTSLSHSYKRTLWRQVNLLIWPGMRMR